MGRRGRPPYPDILTPREWEVLRLVEDGYTNDEIASRLGISLAGAKFHVSEILGKLHLSNRDEAAHWYRARYAPVPLWAPLLDWLRPTPQKVAGVVGVAVIAVTLAGLTALGFAVAGTDTSDSPREVPRVQRPFIAPAQGFVYMEHPEGNPARLVTFDTQRMEEVASFDVTAAMFDPVELVGDRVIVNYGDRVATNALDGSDDRTVREAADGWAIANTAVSPDGTVLAVAEVAYVPCTWAIKFSCYPFEASGRIILVDLTTRVTLQEIPYTAPGLDGLRGWVAGMYWFGDSSGLTVQTRVPVQYDRDGTMYADASGGTAVVGTDGSARRFPIDDIQIYDGQLGPNGRRFGFTGETLGQCDGYSARTEAALYDLQTGATVASVRPESRLVSNVWFVWSPDGSELMYSTLDFAGASDSCSMVYNTEQWGVLHADGSPAETNVDQIALRERWYGERLITYGCQGGRQMGVSPFAYCPFGQTLASYRGQHLATTWGLEVLGWFDASVRGPQ